MQQFEPFIDAHQHFWQVSVNLYPWLGDEPVRDFRYGDYSALKRDYLPADFVQDAGAITPSATVHIEAEWERETTVSETRWLHALAEHSGLPSVVVAYVPLGQPAAQETMDAQAAFCRTRGVRCKPLTATRPDRATRGLAGSMDDSRWRSDYETLASHGLSFDLQAPWWDFDQAAALAADFPDIPMVINHTGLPSDRSPEGLASWRCALHRMAQHDHVCIKISGLGQLGVAWTQAANVPLMRDAISIFGVERCMFASNFPVDSLVATYEEIHAGFYAAISTRPAAQRRMLLHDNAKRIYRI